MSHRLIVGVLVAVFVVCRFAYAEQTALTSLLKPLDLVGYRSGTMPPRFSARTIDARQISISELRGRVVIVNFWASWCLECRPEMPALERLHREFTAHGLSVISVNAREDRAAVSQYARELGLTFPLGLDPDGKINSLYGVIGLPTTFVIARDGRAVAFAIGPREWGSASARAMFGALLAEPFPSASAP